MSEPQEPKPTEAQNEAAAHILNRLDSQHYIEITANRWYQAQGILAAFLAKQVHDARIETGLECLRWRSIQDRAIAARYKRGLLDEYNIKSDEQIVSEVMEEK